MYNNKKINLKNPKIYLLKIQNNLSGNFINYLENNLEVF